MNANIKTCAKCGAKNFSNFTSCFNCGSMEFLSGDNAAQRDRLKLPTDRKSEFTNLKDIELPKRDSDEVTRDSTASRQFNFSRSSESIQPSQPATVTSQKVQEIPPVKEVASVDEEIKAQVQTKNQPLPEMEDQSELVKLSDITGVGNKQSEKEPMKYTFSAIHKNPQSKLNMHAHEELLSKKQTEVESDTVLAHIVEKLTGMERKLDTVSIGQSTGVDLGSVRESVNGDINKLDREIENLKNDNKQVMDLLVRTQKEQIAKLETELKESSERLLELREGRGKDQEALLYLDEQKRTLEKSLKTEKERFEMLLRDREQSKELSEVNSLMSVDVPNDYVVYTGTIEDPAYIDYAKRQFLKIYPKIVSDAEHEDVIYYIPGEFKNPPVLVLNPNVTKNYARNLKLNLLGGDEKSQLSSGEKPLIGGDTKQSQSRPLSAVELARKRAGLDNEQSDDESDEGYASQSQQRLNKVVEPPADIPVRRNGDESSSVRFVGVEDERSMEKPPVKSEDRQRHSVQEESRSLRENSRSSQENPMDKLVANMSAPSVIDSNSITKIPDISQVERQHIESRSKWRICVSSVILGILLLLSLGTLAFPYISLGETGAISGHQPIVAVWLSIFQGEPNEYMALETIASGSLAVVAPYIKYIVLAQCGLSVITALTFIIGCKKGGVVKALKYIFVFLTLATEIFLVIAISKAFGDMVYSHYGLWIKLGVTAVVAVLSIFLLNFKKEKEELDNIKPLNVQVSN